MRIIYFNRYYWIHLCYLTTVAKFQIFGSSTSICKTIDPRNFQHTVPESRLVSGSNEILRYWVIWCIWDHSSRIYLYMSQDNIITYIQNKLESFHIPVAFLGSRYPTLNNNSLSFVCSKDRMMFWSEWSTIRLSQSMHDMFGLMDN